MNEKTHEQNILDAAESGLSAGQFDGIDTTEFLECRCGKCLTVYWNNFHDGVDKAPGVSREQQP